MRYLLAVFAFLTFSLPGIAADVSEEVEKLQDEFKGRMKVWAVKEEEYEAPNGKEYFVLKFESRQDIRDNHLNYEMHVAVQLTDKKTKTVGYAQSVESPGPITDIDKYADHTEWEFRIPFGEMKKPKITACAIEFGFVKQGEFIPIAVEYDKVDSADEIVAAGGQKFGMKCRGARHYYWMDN
jgi:hypothetical protein